MKGGVRLENLLQVKNLSVAFRTDRESTTVVSGASFSIKQSEVAAIVGESGSGKSVTAMSLLRLLASPPAQVLADEMTFFSDGASVDLFACPDQKLRAIRGNRISMVFQEPMTSLNPTLAVGRQITEVLQLHKGMGRRESENAACGLLAEVGMTEPRRQLGAFPHQLSGGMRQRVMIAIALACRPDLLIADEPTTALDVTIQAQIMELLNELRKKNKMAVLLITHNMGLVAEMADTVAVMYAGQIVESASSKELFTNTLHPYTKGLLESVPNLSEKRKNLVSIPGTIPSPRAWPSGCRFHPRCGMCQDECREKAQELWEASPGHFVRCGVQEEKRGGDIG
jgi:oligopeptide/dipeptide ABC transporter ATP-binding protein